LALLYQNQGRYDEAEPLLKRSLSIYEQQLGTSHPSTQTVRENYIALLHILGHDEEAKALEGES